MESKAGLGFLGAGNMAEGILAAALERKLCAPAEVIVSDPQADRRELFVQRFGVQAVADNRAVVRQAGQIVIAVKPQSFADLAAEIRAEVTDRHLWISIMAGVSTARIAMALEPLSVSPPQESAPARRRCHTDDDQRSAAVRVVRAMPNLPIRVGAGVTGLCGGAGASGADLTAACRLFEAGGAAIVLPDEALMDAVTAVSGSGPAYFYYVVEALVAGGVACGLSEADALTLARHTCLGAARMMIETGEPPAELRRKVTSKGGTTQAALEHLERTAAGRAFSEAVQAAFRRGRELNAGGG